MGKAGTEKYEFQTFGYVDAFWEDRRESFNQITDEYVQESEIAGQQSNN